jgi:hypothetical protein
MDLRLLLMQIPAFEQRMRREDQIGVYQLNQQQPEDADPIDPYGWFSSDTQEVDKNRAARLHALHETDFDFD